MTPQEAKKILHPETTLEAYAETDYYGGFNGAKKWKESVDEACLVACEALEKQIPKKPYKTKEPISQKQNDYYCSVCKRYLGDDMELKHACLQPKYCQHCGQALDWSDT